MRGFKAAKPTQSGVVAAVPVVHGDVVVGALVVRFDLELVEHLIERG